MRVGSCPSGQRRRPAAPGDDKTPSPDQQSFDTLTSTTTQGRQSTCPRSIPACVTVLTLLFRVVHHSMRVLPYQVLHTIIGDAGLARRAELWPYRYYVIEFHSAELTRYATYCGFCLFFSFVAIDLVTLLVIDHTQAHEHYERASLLLPSPQPLVLKRTKTNFHERTPQPLSSETYFKRNDCLECPSPASNVVQARYKDIPHEYPYG